MAMTAVWTMMIVCSAVFGACTGHGEAVSAAAAEGSRNAVTLCIEMTGVMCLWSGVMEVMRRCGLTEALRHALSPLLKVLFPGTKKDPESMDLIAANVSANLLGLGNAATPLGIQAAKKMARTGGGSASDDLCRFVVCNTASIQLIPTTVAALRSGAGCESPFDILPAVWLTSGTALLVGLMAAFVFSKVWRDGE